MFGPTRSGEGPFRLLAKEWKRDYGIITYAGLEYQTPSSSAYTTWMVDIDEQSRVVRRVKEVKGRQVRYKSLHILHIIDQRYDAHPAPCAQNGRNLIYRST